MKVPRLGCGAAILDAEGRWLLARRLTAPEALPAPLTQAARTALAALR